MTTAFSSEGDWYAILSSGIGETGRVAGVYDGRVAGVVVSLLFEPASGAGEDIVLSRTRFKLGFPP